SASNGIVMEYLPRGSLESYLVDRKKRIALTHLEPDLLRFIMQIAIGMVALQKHRIIHRDLAARNILISARPNSSYLDVKIADFGLSRSIPTSKDEYIDSSSLFLPTKWLAPECYSSNPRFTMQSDVWSFGVTGFEILDPTSKVVSMLPSDPSILTRKFESGWRLEKPGEMKKWMYSLLLRCWSMEPEDRITFQQIVELLG
uniref:Protein kinase domain-containing protein n=1 Tax=Ciona savignyi TaxID=51511 RepID=H2Z6Y5_CIOSA